MDPNLTRLCPSRQDVIKQEATKTGKNPIMASWLLNSAPRQLSGFHGFLLKDRPRFRGFHLTVAE
jgi:hypothetical protein